MASAIERPHGRAKYIEERCRCRICRNANTAYQRNRRRQQAYGRPASVDAEPVRRHLRALSEAKIGWRRAAELAGVSPSAVSYILWGQPGHPPAKRIRRATAEKILAVEADSAVIADAALVDITRSRRQLQALIATGRTQQELALRLGMAPENFAAMLHHRQNVTAARQRKIDELYDELWDKPPADSPSARRARRYAQQHAFAPPMAWDDDALSDPDAEPEGVAYAAARARGRARQLPPDDELLELLTTNSPAAVARRFGVTPAAVERARYRAKRRAA